jgi:hypothetical protein
MMSGAQTLAIVRDDHHFRQARPILLAELLDRCVGTMSIAASVRYGMKLTADL